MDMIRQSLFAIFANPISNFFAWLIFAWLAISLIFIFIPYKRKSHFINSASTALTSLGILGTFAGIFIGLLEFDVNDISASVPKLLQGLKAAFGTSILGLASALLFRTVLSVIGMLPRADIKSGSPDNTISEAIASIEEKLMKASQDNYQVLAEIQRALGGEQDTSYINQVRLMRQDISDMGKESKEGVAGLNAAIQNASKEQVSAFNDFAEHLRENFSKALIEELKGVIELFNEKLSEQFGENFKQLNIAVGRLLEWQENYKEEMAALKGSLDQSIASIQATEKSILNIQSAMQPISSHVEKIVDLMSRMDKQINTLEKGMEVFAEIEEQAKSVFPAIQKNMNDLTSKLGALVQRQVEVCNTIMKQQEKAQTELETGYKKLRSELDKLGQEISSVVSDAMADVQKTIASTLEAESVMMKEEMEQIKSTFDLFMTNVNHGLEKAIGRLDQAMEDEVSKLMQVMVNHLAGVTKAFTDDYEPLLQEMRKIVELGRHARQDLGQTHREK